jgi:hypothetical protein
MATKFMDGARRVIELVKQAGITERQGVLILVFSRRGHRVIGYLNANPYNAARAMVEFLVQKYPHGKPPASLRRAMTP